ncbi:MFS transporter [Streptomyces sp. NPDC047987]|uniref:MFS transporter n=1 Tax=unclassified Streptomyces TaxID=2593676 RepID=UPI00343FB527
MTSARSHQDSGPFRRAGRMVGRALRSPFSRALRSPFTGAARGIRKATHAHGAGESGLGKLIELHAVNGAGDVMITVALASTVFFAVPTDEARGRVALYLAVTMAPFTLLAPVIGPLLDRLPHGRRAAMAGAMLARAVLALTIAGAVATGGLELYPAALGVLVCSKAYGVVRSAVVPRLLPPRISLVKANARVTLAGLLATGVAAPIGAGLQFVGPAWPLYGACGVFLGGTVLAFTLPPKVDSAKGERRARLVPPYGVLPPRPRVERSKERCWEQNGAGDREENGEKNNGAKSNGEKENGEKDNGERVRANRRSGRGRRLRGREREGERRPGLRTVGPSVLNGLQANAAHRALSGLLIFFLAFLLRDEPLTGQNAAVSLGIVGVAAGLGNALGTAVGSWLRARGPEVIAASVLALALGAAMLAAFFFGTVTVAVLSATAGFTQALSKLSLDAMIQRDVPEEVRASAFARSETVLQMAWVVGGGIGIVLPLNGVLGMSVAAGVLALGAATSVRGLLGAARRGSPHPRVA